MPSLQAVDPAQFRQFVELWNELAQDGNPSLPVIKSQSATYQQLLEVWNSLPDLREGGWQLLLEGIANNRLLSGSEPNKHGKPVRLTLDWLFYGVHRRSSFYNWQVIAANRYNTSDAVEDLNVRVRSALYNFRDHGTPGQEFADYLVEKDGWCGRYRINPREFPLALLRAAALRDEIPPPAAPELPQWLKDAYREQVAKGQPIPPSVQAEPGLDSPPSAPQPGRPSDSGLSGELKVPFREMNEEAEDPGSSVYEEEHPWWQEHEEVLVAKYPDFHRLTRYEQEVLAITEID
jgi:hypothetical protein